MLTKASLLLALLLLLLLLLLLANRWDMLLHNPGRISVKAYREDWHD